MLVDNRTSMALQLDPIEIPTDMADRRELFARIGKVLGSLTPTGSGTQGPIRSKRSPASPITPRRDVDDDIVYYLRSIRPSSPRSRSTGIFVRKYPQGLLAAHILGIDRRGDCRGLKRIRTRTGRRRHPGKTGVEQTYDDRLRGQPR